EAPTDVLGEVEKVRRRSKLDVAHGSGEVARVGERAARDETQRLACRDLALVVPRGKDDGTVVRAPYRGAWRLARGERTSDEGVCAPQRQRSGARALLSARAVVGSCDDPEKHAHVDSLSRVVDLEAQRP